MKDVPVSDESAKDAALDRMLVALQFYSSVSDLHKFAEFVNRRYVQLVDDLMQILNDERSVAEMQELKAEAFSMMRQCNAGNCLLLKEEAQTQPLAESRTLQAGKGNKTMFLHNCMDAMHCHPVHAHDVDMRLKKAQLAQTLGFFYLKGDCIRCASCATRTART